MNRHQRGLVPHGHRDNRRALVLIGAHIILTVTLTLTGCAADAPAETPSPHEVADDVQPLPTVSIDDYANVTATLDYAHAAVTLPMDEY